jgi:hypothetical protein
MVAIVPDVILSEVPDVILSEAKNLGSFPAVRQQ